MTKRNQALPNFCKVPATSVEPICLSDHVGCRSRGRVIATGRGLLSTRGDREQERESSHAEAHISCLLPDIARLSPHQSPILYGHCIHPISSFRFRRGSVIFDNLLTLNRDAKQ